jgi:hypothetical protein
MSLRRMQPPFDAPDLNPNIQLRPQIKHVSRHTRRPLPLASFQSLQNRFSSALPPFSPLLVNSIADLRSTTHSPFSPTLRSPLLFPFPSSSCSALVAPPLGRAFQVALQIAHYLRQVVVPLRLLGVPPVHHFALQRQAVDLFRLLVAARGQFLDVVRPVLGAPARFCAQLAQPAKASQLGVR